MPNRGASTLALAIVVPCYNEETQIEACLRSLRDQTTGEYLRRSGEIEIVCVDNNCSDSTVPRVVAFQECHPSMSISVVSESRQGPGWARRKGIDAAICKLRSRGVDSEEMVIGWIDADTVADPLWLEEIARLFSNASISAAAGDKSYSPVLFLEAAKMAPHSYILGILGHEMTDALLGLLRPIRTARLNGANSAIRASVYQAVGGIRQLYHDEDRALLAPGEEYDLAARLFEHGYDVAFMPTNNKTSPRRVIDSWTRSPDANGVHRTYAGPFVPIRDGAWQTTSDALARLTAQEWRREFVTHVDGCIRSLLGRDLVNSVLRGHVADATRVLGEVVGEHAPPVLQEVERSLPALLARDSTRVRSGLITSPEFEAAVDSCTARIRSRVWQWLWFSVLGPSDYPWVGGWPEAGTVTRAAN